MNSASRNLIASAALVSFFFVIPWVTHTPPGIGSTLILLLLAGSGILLSRIFVLSSGSEDPVGIEPSVIVFIASWGMSSLIYPVTLIFAFFGSVINSYRSEREGHGYITAALYQATLFTVLLKIADTVYWQLLSGPSPDSAVITYTALTATALLLTFLRSLSIRLTGGQPGSMRRNLARNLISNGLILLLAVPGALSIEREFDTTTMLITCTAGIFSMLLIHGISIKLNRSAHERTEELDTVLKLRELFQKLFSTRKESEVIRALCNAVSDAWQCRAAVSWKGMKYYEGSPWDTTGAVSCSHPDGLTVWVDSFSSTVPEYLESFVNRTVPVLAGLAAEKKMKQASWESVETMASFLEGNRSDFAGFSRQVAETASLLASSLEKNDWFRDCVKLAGLLHIMDLTEVDASGAKREPLSLPEVTTESLRFQNEHWCGTGPRGMKGEDIPVCARILAVSIAWERALKSGRNVAVRDLRMRAGTLYDPHLVKRLLELRG